MMKNTRLAFLVKRYLAGECTSEEFEELKFFLENKDSSELEEIYDSLPELSHIQFPKHTQEKVFKEILADTQEHFAFNRRNFSLRQKLLAAASLLFIISMSVLFYYYRYSGVKNLDNKVALVTPGYDRAKIVTDDGKILLLDTLTSEDEAKAYGLERKVDQNGKLYFKYLLARRAADNKLHTVTTPKGGQLTLELPDGSKVWMNAESTIQFSNAFIHNERKVLSEGEVYFEVKTYYNEGKKVPFRVLTKGQQIEVLGTEFNVNSYDNRVVTTLVEGKVSIVDKDNNSVTLKPNQQAIWTNKFEIKEVDPLYTTAWKDGDFAFYKSKLEEVMMSIARWYSVDIEYRGNFENDVFTGTISRYEDIDKLLKTMELTGSINLKREGRKIIVQKSNL